MPKEQLYLGERVPRGASKNAKDKSNSAALLASRGRTGMNEDSGGQGSCCSSEKDSGYSGEEGQSIFMHSYSIPNFETVIVCFASPFFAVRPVFPPCKTLAQIRCRRMWRTSAVGRGSSGAVPSGVWLFTATGSPSPLLLTSGNCPPSTSSRMWFLNR